MRKFAYHALLLFSLLGIFFIPFSFGSLEIQSVITKFLFEDLMLLLAARFDHIHIANPEISSDATTLYLLLGILFIISIALTFLLSFSKSLKKHQNWIVTSVQLVLTFYLSLVMLQYGFDKIFKVQFYLPEPNTLFTPLGFLDKDILFWSTMGASYSYSVFMGVLEVVPALLLLFSRTRVLGLFILFGILLNVVFINFGFDISVKLYSCFLLLLCFLLLIPSFKAFLQFFILNKSALLPQITGKMLLTSRYYRHISKGILVLFFLIFTLFPYFQSGNFNDDNFPRMALHGAYEVLKTEGRPNSKSTFEHNLKRVFIHRHNYFILQYEDDTMEDFYLEINPAKNEFILTNYDGAQIHVTYQFSKTTKLLELHFSDLNFIVYSKALPWKNLPLLQPLFHWTVDEVN
jgi:hypothetical protein